jgi:hypothetical protein
VRQSLHREARMAWSWGQHHRTLVARILLALGLTAVVDVVGAVLMWLLERHAQHTEIHDIGDAFFFASVQLLTVSSQLKNPVTPAGRVVDVLLEIWALFVVTGIAGSFAAFFGSMDRARYASGTSQTTPRGGSVTSTE